ncbi:MCMDC2 isoform 7 [Pan troglodytes]|uniref:Minichromosome maintenance domain containing 2 n=2 Tax=Homininae TaxID=207598 RepID=F8WDR8_HUMAN|nr:minichromosome maintenance domain containing 2 [Homo sapiens]KAI4010845.1 minichromosome maintenance domain containing 2 [Homo sapiens]PNI40516.1 MCMDC2 isoform 7 [Pan troglodytes]
MSNLKMKEAALIYLDRSGGLQKFIDDCKYYNGTFSKDAELGNHILHQPLKAAEVFQSVSQKKK